MRYLAIISLTLVNFFYCTAGIANSQQNQLQHLVAQIKNIKNVLQQKHDTRTALQQELNHIETEYGNTSQNRWQIQQQISRQKQRITALENASVFNQNQILVQRQALAEQLRLSYLLLRQGPVKLLLNQQDFGQINRMLFYYQSLNRYRIKTIQNLQVNLERINNQQQQLYAQYQNLRILEQSQLQAEKTLTQMKTNRSQLMNTINQNIKDQKQRLDKLSNDKIRLEQTLAHLTLKTTTLPGNFSNQNFAAQRGHLPWPTKGVVQHYFNTSIAQSELKWNGELILAPDDQPVYAVAPGKVVFSKWLEGYGLLLIINHGRGYMTLYGRNHSLYKHEGDQVTAGELIATVGESGGYDKSALYFAIRFNAKPLDPNQWCQ
jgi:murein hydrolase activator